jgi:hypothetical protein
LYPGQPNTFVQSFSLMQTSVPGVHKYQNPRKTKHLPDSRAEPKNQIKQLHGVLLKYSSKDQDHRGEYKKVTNHVEAFGPALFASPRFQRALWSPSGSFAVESHSESDCRDEAPAPSCAWTDFGEGQGLDCAVRRDEATLHSPNKSVSQACAGSNLPPKSSAGRMRL